MPLIKCLGEIAELNPSMRDKILSSRDKYLKKGLTERQAELKAVEEYGRNLHGQLNGIKEKVGAKKDTYIPYNPKPKIEEIERRYAEKSTGTIPSNEQNSEGQKTESGVQESTIGTGQTEPARTPPVPPVEGKAEGAFAEEKRTEFSHRGLQEVATEFGLDNVSSRDRVSDLRLFKKAEGVIDNWVKEGDYKKNIEEVIKTAESDIGSIGEVENVILAQHIANLRGELNKMDIKNEAFDKKLKELDRVVRAGEKARSKQGAALRVPIIKSYALPDIMQGYMEANRVEKLTDAQKEQAVKDYENIKKKAEDAEQKVMKLEAINNELMAQRNLNKGVYGKKKTTAGKKDYKAERQSLKEKLAKQFEEYKAEVQKLRIVSDGGIESYKISVQMAKTVAEFVKSHVSEIGANLKEVTKRTFEDVKDIIKGITEKDVHDIIAGGYAEVKKTRNQLAADMKDLKDEAFYINKLERLLNGTEPKNEKQRIERNKQITDLKNKIKDFKKEESDANKFYGETDAGRRKIEALEDELGRLQKRMPKEEKTSIKKEQSDREIELKKQISEERKKISEEEKEANKFYTEEYDSDTKKLKAIKKKNEDQTKKVREDIANGNFEKEKKLHWTENNELKEKYPKAYKEALTALSEKEDAKHDYDVAILKADMANRTKLQKGMDWLGAGANTTKKLVTGVDDSSLFMQTLAAMTAHPLIAAKAVKLHALDAFSKKRFEQGLAELHSSPDWPLMQKSGLDVTEPKSLSAANREEIFGGKTWDIKFKVNGKEYKVLETLLSPFERAFTSLGNGMRVIAFRTMAAKFMEEGYTFENNPKLFKDLALMLNTETGRGKQNEYIQKASELVTKGIWSPKLMSSRINMLGMSDAASLLLSRAGTKGYYRQLDPKIRKQALMDLVQYAASVVAISSVAAYSFGGELDIDPTSVTFMDIKFPNGKSYNITGGFAQYIKVLFQTIEGGKTRDGKFEKFKGNKDAGSNLLRFGRGKVTPISGVGIDLLTGKDFSNKPITAMDEAKKLAIPLSMQSLVSDLKRDGLAGLFKGTLPSFIGIQVKDERDFPKKEKTFTIYNKKKGSKRDATPEEYKNYEEKLEVMVKQKLDAIPTTKFYYDNYRDITLDIEKQSIFKDGKPKFVLGKNLTEEEKKKVIEKLTAKANREVKKILFNSEDPEDTSK